MQKVMSCALNAVRAQVLFFFDIVVLFILQVKNQVWDCLKTAGSSGEWGVEFRIQIPQPDSELCSGSWARLDSILTLVVTNQYVWSFCAAEPSCPETNGWMDAPGMQPCVSTAARQEDASFEHTS